MRVLHTSDWHLGRSFHREELLSAQSVVMDHLVDVVRSERVDVVAVSGDIYDRALPGTDAVDLLDDTLTRLAALAKVIVISGNHDSSKRLGFGHRLIDLGGVFVRTDPAAAGEPVLLDDEHGPVAFYPLPYLEPDTSAAAVGCDERSHAAVVRAAMQRVRRDLAARRAGTRSVVLAHVFAAGGAGCESERDISVGGLSDVPVAAFRGVDYVALGHLHGQQSLSPRVRYSGSPLAYSFGEARQRKGSWLVELGPDGLGEVTRIEAPVPRALARLTGDLDSFLRDARWAAYESHYLAITLTDPVRPREPMARLRERFPHTLQLAFEPEGGVPRDTRTYSQRVRGHSDYEIARGFVEHVRERAAADWEQTLLREAVEYAAREPRESHEKTA